jgi:hypothetical protein
MVHSLLVLRTLVLIPLTLFEKNVYFRQKFETVLPVDDFSPKKKKTGVNVALCVLVLSWAINTCLHYIVGKKFNIYVMLQGAKFKHGITLVQEQLFMVVYFQAPYCNFCHYNKTCAHFIMYFTYIMSNI